MTDPDLELGYQIIDSFFGNTGMLGRKQLAQRFAKALKERRCPKCGSVPSSPPSVPSGALFDIGSVPGGSEGDR